MVPSLQRTIAILVNAALLPTALLALVACSGPGAGGVDAGGPDAAMTGLLVKWQTSPAVPGLAEDDLEVTSVSLELREFHLIGDGAPGDERTTVHRASLSWADGKVASDAAMPDAPAGIYSRLAGTVDGDGAPSYQLEGRVRLAGEWRPYRIVDRGRVVFEDGILLTAGPGQTPFEVEIEVDHVLDAADFGALPEREGVLVLDETDPGISAVRRALAEAFDGD